MSRLFLPFLFVVVLAGCMTPDQKLNPTSSAIPGTTTHSTTIAQALTSASRTASPSTTSAPTSTFLQGPTGPAPSVIAYGRQGDSVMGPFETKYRLLRISSKHDGGSNFIVQILNQDGEREALVVNAIGPYNGARYAIIQPGNHTLAVRADGNWNIQIEQPTIDSAYPAPVNETGWYDAAPPCFFLEKGLHKVHFQDGGDSNFIVHLIGASGAPNLLLVNEISPYQGTVPVRIEFRGTYCFDIISAGPWSIDFEP